MTTITTKLVKDGNSIAVRLPKTLLAMSGLSGVVQLEAKKGQIMLRTLKKPRDGWQEQITKVSLTTIAKVNDPELTDWETTDGDGLD